MRIHRSTRARVSGLGAAGHGAHHWWVQRVSSVALVVLAPLFAVPFARALGGEYGDVLALYANPFHAIIGALFIGTVFYHLALGLQVIIEDYVHAKAWRIGMLLGTPIACTALALVGIFAVLKIAVTG